MEGSRHFKRRIHRLACHLGLADSTIRRSPFLLLSGFPASAPCFQTHTSIRETIQRRDYRTLFSRQSRENYGQFTRQSDQQVVKTVNDEYAHLRPESLVRPVNCSEAQSSSTCNNARKDAESGVGPTFEDPLFGRPASRSDATSMQSIDGNGEKGDFVMAPFSVEMRSTPLERYSSEFSGLAHQNRAEIGKTASSAANEQAKLSHPECLGFEWFPRMDVVESGTAYVITIELPGVSADGIHVEVVRGRYRHLTLIVTGSRSFDWWKCKSDGNGEGGTVYHRRELAQGPYRAMWSLPKNGDVNGITAEFIDGFLRILVPKIKMTTYL